MGELEEIRDILYDLGYEWDESGAYTMSFPRDHRSVDAGGAEVIVRSDVPGSLAIEDWDDPVVFETRVQGDIVPYRRFVNGIGAAHQAVELLARHIPALEYDRTGPFSAGEGASLPDDRWLRLVGDNTYLSTGAPPGQWHGDISGMSNAPLVTGVIWLDGARMRRLAEVSAGMARMRRLAEADAGTIPPEWRPELLTDDDLEVILDETLERGRFKADVWSMAIEDDKVVMRGYGPLRMVDVIAARGLEPRRIMPRGEP